MTGTSIWGVAAPILAAAVAGTVLWAVAIVGVAQYAEDLCFDDLDNRVGYGGFRMDSSLWPPSHDCRLLGDDVEPLVVHHRGAAVARLAALVVLPVGYAVAATLAIGFWQRRRRAPALPPVPPRP